jgi:hypothetical protein
MSTRRPKLFPGDAFAYRMTPDEIQRFLRRQGIPKGKCDVPF